MKPQCHVSLFAVIACFLCFLCGVCDAADVHARRTPFLTAGTALDEAAGNHGASSVIHVEAAVASYNRETPVVVNGRRLPLTVEGVFAGVFVCMIASVPLVVARFEEATLTKTHVALSIVLLGWLVGCLYLFTRVIYFRSIHFSGQRPLTLVETIYLMAQVLTTVGHGDITPATPRGRVVVGLYVFLTILLVADMVSLVVSMAIVRTREYTNTLARLAAGPPPGLASGPSTGEVKVEDQHHSNVRAFPVAKAECVSKQCSVHGTLGYSGETDWIRRTTLFLPWARLFAAFASFLFLVLVGVLFYHFYPGENKTWLDAVYMAIITLSTVGFGAVIPVTEAGKVFGAFWMLFGVVSLLSLVSVFTELVLAMKERERWNSEDEHAELGRLRERALETPAHDGRGDAILVVSRHDFLRFGVMQSGLVSREELDRIEQTFQTFGPNESDHVPLEAIEQAAKGA